MSLRFLSRLRDNTCEKESIGKKTLKGIEKIVSVYNVTALKEQKKDAA